jgi:16S rRNA (adenine1518-N6/adenine1519-N6)-dimethyltransferase
MAHDLNLKKSLGQHFLHDENMCKKIVSHLTHTPGMNLLEVGPGGGAITKYLLQLEDVNYIAIEVDREKVDYLNAHYPQMKGKIILQDILKADQPFAANFSLIGNFPYNISSPIMFKVLEWETNVTEVIGMFQKEVAQRIAAGPGSKTYGILSVLLQAFFKVEYLFDVNQNCFTPPPKVISGVLRCTNLHNPHGIADKRKFIMLVKAAFNQRRKTLRNALKSYVPASMLTHPYMDKRAEQLSVAQFVELYKLVLSSGAQTISEIPGSI